MTGVRDVIGPMETTPGSKRGKQRGRAAFVANMAAIREALEAGAHLTEIHHQHAGRLGIGYSQFCKYVRKHKGLKEACSCSVLFSFRCKKEAPQGAS